MARGIKTNGRKQPSVFDEDNIPQMDNEEITDNNETMTNINDNSSITDAEIIESNTTPPTVNDDPHKIGDEYNPLQGETKKRDYATKAGLEASGNEQIIERVPEPKITMPPPPPPNKNAGSNTMSGESQPPINNGGAQTTAPQPQKLNPDMQGLPEKDAKQASTLLVDAILDGYKQFWGFTSKWVEVSDDKIIEWVMQDQISLDIRIGVGEDGKEASLKEVYDTFNSQAKEALTVNLTSQSFQDVRAAMVREFTKRGWGISDMQYIIQHFVRDAGQRSLAVYQLKSTMNNFTKSVMKSYEETKKLREELFQQQAARVEKSEPTVIKKEKPTPPAQETPQQATVYSENFTETPNNKFVETFEMPNSEVTNPNVREVPFYDGDNKRSEAQNIGVEIVPIESNQP